MKDPRIGEYRIRVKLGEKIIGAGSPKFYPEGPMHDSLKIPLEISPRNISALEWEVLDQKGRKLEGEDLERIVLGVIQVSSPSQNNTNQNKNTPLRS